MRRRWMGLALILACCGAQAFDPLGSERDLAALPPPGLLPLDAELVGGPACPGPLAAGKVSLAEVVKRALCQDPRTRQAWADSRLQAARLGIARSAYLPTVSATLSQARSGQTVTQGGASARTDATTRIGQLDLAWNLFDFGQREAGIEVPGDE